MNFIKKLWRNPMIRRAAIWAAPIIFNFIVRKLASRKPARSK